MNDNNFKDGDIVQYVDEQNNVTYTFVWKEYIHGSYNKVFTLVKSVEELVE